MPILVLDCPQGDSPIHHTAPQLWGAHRTHSTAGGRADLGKLTLPLCQDAAQVSEDEAESCTHHHLAGYIPDIPILAWLAILWLLYTANAALL